MQVCLGSWQRDEVARPVVPLPILRLWPSSPPVGEAGHDLRTSPVHRNSAGSHPKNPHVMMLQYAAHKLPINPEFRLLKLTRMCNKTLQFYGFV
jgi:hypothetical protein